MLKLPVSTRDSFPLTILIGFAIRSGKSPTLVFEDVDCDGDGDGDCDDDVGCDGDGDGFEDLDGDGYGDGDGN